MANDVNQVEAFLPKHEAARIAVERARRIVKDNNEMISKIKLESNLDNFYLEENELSEAENFSCDDTYTFDLYKIKNTSKVTEFFKGMFGVH